MANRSVRQSILVTGAHRSGTTWVGKMLAASGQLAYISEPLNVHHRPGVFRTPVDHWYTYICEDNENQYLPALRDTAAFRYHLGAEIRSLRSTRDFLRMGRDWWTFTNGKLRRQRPLLKDPFALFSAGWFAERLNYQVVIMVRHPAAFASSLKRLGWQFDFSNLLAQPLLMRDWLEPFRADMDTAIHERPNDDIIGQGALLWRMLYKVVYQLGKQHQDFHIVRHEDLSQDPLTRYHKLYQALGLSFTARARQTIQSASSPENPSELSRNKVHTVHLDSQANIKNWAQRLTEAEVDRIRNLTEDVAPYFYSEQDWRS